MDACVRELPYFGSRLLCWEESLLSVLSSGLCHSSGRQATWHVPWEDGRGEGTRSQFLIVAFEWAKRGCQL